MLSLSSLSNASPLFQPACVFPLFAFFFPHHSLFSPPFVLFRFYSFSLPYPSRHLSLLSLPAPPISPALFPHYPLPTSFFSSIFYLPCLVPLSVLPPFSPPLSVSLCFFSSLSLCLSLVSRPTLHPIPIYSLSRRLSLCFSFSLCLPCRPFFPIHLSVRSLLT